MHWETQVCMTRYGVCSSKPIKRITSWRDSSIRRRVSVLLYNMQVASRWQFANIFAMILFWKSACNLHAQWYLMIHAAHKLLHQLMMDVIAAVNQDWLDHCNDVIMGATASQITRLTVVYSKVYRRKSKKTSKLRVTCLCEGNSPVTDEFTTQRANNAESVSIWWCHHVWRDICLNDNSIWLSHLS